MQTFKISIFVLLLMCSFGLSTTYAVPAGTANTTTQKSSKKLTKSARKAFKKSLKAKIKQERKKLKQLRKKAKREGTKANKTQRDFSNRLLLIGLAIGIGLLVLSNLSSIFGLIGTLIVLAVIVLFLLRYI